MSYRDGDQTDSKAEADDGRKYWKNFYDLGHAPLSPWPRPHANYVARIPQQKF
jgi:hypothetical protein